MNNKSERYKSYAILTFLITGLALALSLSGCLGTESKTNISIGAPEAVEVLGGRVETLSIELVPQDADAKNVIVNLTAPPGISLTDPHISFQQYSKQFERISKGKKEIIFFNYSASLVHDEYSLTLNVKADNSNATEHKIKMNLSFPAPKWEVGEYWVLNQKEGDLYGNHIQQVLRKESLDGKEVYVVKDIFAREVNGTYRLYYYAVEDLAHVKTEYYEDDTLVGKMTETIDPPSRIYGFPFNVGKTWNWNGTISGIGRTEFKGEVLGREKVKVKEKDYDAYKIRFKYIYPLGTGSWDMWYSPDMKGVIIERGVMNMGGLVKESNTELVQHGFLPDEPPSIQQALQVPQGWKSYSDAEQRLSFSYPDNWRLNKSLKSAIYVEHPKTSTKVIISIEPVGKMTLEDYSKIAKNKFYRDFGKIDYENYTEVNLRTGYEFSTSTEYKSSDAALYISDNGIRGEGQITNIRVKEFVFVANEKGYIISSFFMQAVDLSKITSSSTFESFDNADKTTAKIIDSIIITESPVYTLLERK